MQPSQTNFRNTFLLPFDWFLWITMCATWVAIFITSAVAEKVCAKIGRACIHEGPTEWSSHLWAVAAMCQRSKIGLRINDNRNKKHSRADVNCRFFINSILVTRKNTIHHRFHFGFHRLHSVCCCNYFCTCNQNNSNSVFPRPRGARIRLAFTPMKSLLPSRLSCR